MVFSTTNSSVPKTSFSEVSTSSLRSAETSIASPICEYAASAGTVDALDSPRYARYSSTVLSFTASLT